MRKSAVRVALALLLLTPGSDSRSDPGLTVVELFTSQGCASCPPADAVLASLASQRHILPLSEHVDYWDYLGWPDTFALAEATARQKSYAARLGLPYVYTPQMIIQGSTHVMGADPADVEAAIAAAPPPLALSVAIRRDGSDTLVITLGRAALAGPVDLWLALYDHEHAMRIGGGENLGRNLRYVNVVRALRRVGTWGGEAATVTVTLPEGKIDHDDCAVLVQEPDGGRILAAARLPPP